MDTMRVCARIDLDAIEHNIKSIKNNLSTVANIIAVIKSDGYGHGSTEIVKQITKMDEICGFAVATFEEAKQLYVSRIRKPVLILGYTFQAQYGDIVDMDFRPTVFTRRMAKEYSEAARECGKPVRVHIKIDTGMGRIGYPVCEGSADEIASIFKDYDNLIPEGLFTHFARADEIDKHATDLQYQKYSQMCKMLEERGVHFEIHHASNSAAIMEYPDAHLDAVRAGIILYGLWPSDEVDHNFDIKPALSLISHVVHVKTVQKGDAISYGGTYVADTTRRIATIPVGYADGYSRGLSGKGYVLIRGKKAPIVGRICMDQFMVDVTDIDGVEVLDEVILIGKDGNEEISLEEIGDISGRFNYEFACCLGNRIPRLYYKGGKQVSVKEYY